MTGLHIILSALFFFLMLGGMFWMGQFIWFPGGESLLGLLVHDAEPPTKANEVWAMDLYQATFSPDCGARWVQSLMVGVSWTSWIFLLVLAMLGTLSVAGLLPKTPITFWLVISDFLLWTITMALLPILLFVELVLLNRKGVLLNFRSRKARWIDGHPAPKNSWPSGKLPWWFWLDSGGFETLLRMTVFLGGFLASIAAIFYFSHASDPKVITIEGFWSVLSLWVLAIIWLTIPLTIWLSHLDWTHRNRELLLLWAGKQR
ncbi:MAG: hypothetical protein WCY91_02135 [Acidithiobacillus sp.]|jgi:hypothetical protein|uniref:Uncharacterized protein n=1 Tax=Acidithiobacillus ferruginosus TaxID=3063951 RepID=A0ACD5IJR9_9PROT|nr:hypothetical protein [Acidithiobacillus ferruginosus]MDD2746392.1 hypothetical protein [Acidithiobacillus ferrooxidans]MDD5002842.1 hypothetical protein [Acidithiobacillus sp.]MBU2813588.1 hypothetical protein [Acidithiobacillus ferruginosus]MDD5379573.1 hypothetical protein [Acidithiobacillus sp.]MDD5575867.1 hypothetical protein [Acidithiobacillus sp.]